MPIKLVILQSDKNLDYSMKNCLILTISPNDFSMLNRTDYFGGF